MWIFYWSGLKVTSSVISDGVSETGVISVHLVCV